METYKFLMVTTHYPPYHLGGDAQYVEYLSRELVKRGHEVHVLHSPAAFELLRNRTSGLESETEIEGVRVHRYTARMKRFDPLLSLTFGTWMKTPKLLASIAHDVKPDVVHWHNTKGFIGCPIEIPGSIAVYTAHDFYSVCPRSNLLRPGARICERPKLCQLCLLRWKKPPQLWRIRGMRPLHFPTSMTLVSPSVFLAKRLMEDGIHVNHVLRNFVPDRGVRVGPISERRIILYLGLMEIHKGPMTLLQAFARSRNNHGFTLQMLGEGSLRQYLMDSAAQLNLGDRVQIPGFKSLDDIDSMLTQTAAVVVPSECYENAPLAALEALSMGISVVGSDLGGIPEVAGPESGSMLFKGGDADSLADSLSSLWAMRDELPEMSRKARSAYKEKYSPENHLMQYMNIIGKAGS